jgi:hypothetical protein
VRFVRFVLCVSTILSAAFTALPAKGQTPGDNVNMVSGTKWPGGDPFLQRQNEPALAVSTRNPRHLLAGANDYRSVDIPNPNATDERGDAWLGVFKSLDGGATWGSTLLPGYPQDQSAIGLASPIHGFSTAADPLVRSGTNGLFYYSGIAFNRSTNLGNIFVARFMDLNNKENGDASQSLDPIQYVNTVVIDAGTSGQFLDKPWIAVDVPRGTAKCTIQVPQGGTTVTQTVPAGNVYIVWSRFTGSTSTKIMFSSSQDCGASWSNPVKLSESNSINQGTTLAIDPNTGALYVAWRRFVTSSQPDAVVSVKSSDFGKTFTKSLDVVDLSVFNSSTPNAPSFFDQGTTPSSFRTSAFPTLGVDPRGTVYLAWSQRGLATGGDARIAMATSPDGLNWSAPLAVDNGALSDINQPILDNQGDTLIRGHQIMPQITIIAGKLFVLYYDFREDHTTGRFLPHNPFLSDANGNFYSEDRLLEGELPGSPGQVFTPFLTDSGLAQRRHTIDLVVAQADTSLTPFAFSTARVSRYNFGLRNDAGDLPGFLQQLQVDPPNLPLFEQGNDPFMGDYIDVAGQTFLPPSTPGGSWTFNTSTANTPVVYATWTSNQDVRPPKDGNWQNYTPVGGGGNSIFSPGTTTPVCAVGQEGMRNQNIYSSRITQGLVVSVPQNSKPLSTTLQRSFIGLVQNFTNLDRSFRLSISNQPAGGMASFLPVANNPVPPPPYSPTTTLDVTIAAHSGVVRPIFVLSSNPAASITLNVVEISGIGGTPVTGGLSSFALLNPDPTAPALVNPDGNTAGSISTAEIYDANISNPNINANISNANISNANISNPNVNANISNANISNANISNPNINANISNANISNPDIASANISNANISNSTVSNANISNANISNANISNAPVTDATYTITNAGNTTGSYAVKLAGNAPTNANLQLILSKAYQTPTNLNCQLALQTQIVPVVNVNSPVVQGFSAAALADPAITDPTIPNATVTLAPGESALVTIRGNLDPVAMQNVPTLLAPVVTAHEADTNSDTRKVVIALFIPSSTLPSGTVNVPYNAALQAIGAVPPYTWAIPALPAGLTLNAATGTIAGTPTTAGTLTFTVAVSDSSSPPVTTDRTVTLMLQQANTTTLLASSANPSVFGQQVSITATVGTGPVFPSGTVTFMDGTSPLGTATLSNGTVSLSTSALALGSHSITATYGGDGNFVGSASKLTQTVNQASSLTTVSASPSSAVFGQPLNLNATVTALAPGAGIPTGTVTFLDNAKSLGTAILNNGSAGFAISSLPIGNHSFTASYGGDANFLASGPSAGFAETISQARSSTAVISTQNPSAFGQSVTFTVAVSAVSPGVGTPTGFLIFTDGTTTLGTANLNNGAANFTSSTLAVGTHSITVSYAGDASFLASVSTALTQNVNKAATGTGISSQINPSVFGQPVTLTSVVSTVTPGAAIPTGTVTFMDGLTTLGTASLNNGSAGITTAALAPGNHSIQAIYGGIGNFLGGASGALAQIVSKANTSTTITSVSPSTVTVGQQVKVTFGVAVSPPGGGTPTGTVTVSDGAGVNCAATLPATSCSMTSVAVGAKTLTATYSGDTNFSGSSGTSTQQEVVTYVFTGFFSPLSVAGTFSSPSNSGTGNLGHAIPIKWSLQDGQGNFISNLNTTTLLEAIFNPSCSGAPTGQATLLYSPTVGAKGGSTFRFSTNQFVFNWDTSTGVTSGCYTLVLQLNDGSPLKATTILLK